MREYDCPWDEWMRPEAAANGTAHLQFIDSFCIHRKKVMR